MDLKHDIKPYINEHFSCHQILLATYAINKNRKYDMLFADTWGFGYNIADKTFASSLHPSPQNRREELLLKYHGIKLNTFDYYGFYDLKKIVESSLPESPLLLFCDVFNCPWNISFNRNHIAHCIMIVGSMTTISGEKHIIIDPYSTSNENIIDLCKVASAKNKIQTFSIAPLKQHPLAEYEKEIQMAYKHVRETNFFEHYKMFLDDFTVRFDEVVSSDYLDVYAIPLVINLRQIACQRYCFDLFLKKMIEIKLLDQTTHLLMASIADKYSLLRTLVIRQILKKKNTGVCIDIIKNIIEMEMTVYDALSLCV